MQQQALASAPDRTPAHSSVSLRMSAGSALQESVELLTACRPEALHKLEQLTGSKKVLALFRGDPEAMQACGVKRRHALQGPTRCRVPQTRLNNMKLTV